jgi:hypothetical protein
VRCFAYQNTIWFFPNSDLDFLLFFQIGNQKNYKKADKTNSDKNNRKFTREILTLELGAGGELAGCFQPRCRIGDGFMDTNERFCPVAILKYRKEAFNSVKILFPYC